MPTFEVDLPDKIDGEIDRLVNQGEFLNREQAIEELLSRGVSVYDRGDVEESPEASDDLFTQTVSDQQDPAARNTDADDRPY